MQKKIRLALIAKKIKGLTNDSREVKPGWAFVAYKGVNQDIHNYIPEAREKGASFIIGESGQVDLKVKDGREALALLSALYYGRPAEKMKLIGVTGTNGKTSTAKMIAAILNAAGLKTAVFGTVGYYFGKNHYSAKETTPDPITLHRLLKKFFQAGARLAVLETTSQGLEQKRLFGLKFKIAVFTNLTQDHLDYHQNMAEYLRAKMILFKNSEIAVLNASDPASGKIERIFSGQVVKYSPRAEIKLKMLGKFNQYNAAAAWAVARLLKIKEAVILRTLKKVFVPGRFELVGERVIVDYAHTPDALENILKNARDIAKGRVICVFGCGGDRDPYKRPLMGAIAARLADFVFITSDNPRSESPQKIIKDIVQGIKTKNYQVIESRKLAIKVAIKFSSGDDLILIAGKGHETYQIIGDKKYHFDDREEAKKWVEV